MATNLAALIFALMGIALAAVLFPKMLDRKWGFRLAQTYAALAALAFLVPNNLASLALAGVVMAFFAPKAITERVAFFVATLPALPIYHNATVPFPGLNYLIDINFGMISILVVLTPTLFMKTKAPPSKSFGMITAMVFGFVLLISLLDFRILPFTSVLRSSFTNVITMGVTYLAISRAIRTKEDFNAMLRAIFASVIFVASIGVISFFREWNFYTQLYDGVGFIKFADYRFGLRVQSTLMTTLVGYMMAFGVILIHHYMAQKKLRGLQAYGLLAIFLFVLVVSGSRGAYICALAMFGSYGAYRIAPGLVRMLMFPTVATLCAIIIGWFGSGRLDQLATVDQYGTFDYRIRLFRAGLKQIRENFLFGSGNFIEDPNFAHLVQGQGIIDIVNTYLQIALEFGVIALFLFVLPFIIVIRALSRNCAYTARLKDVDSQHVSKTSAVMTAALIAFMLMIMSVSDQSYIIHYSFMFLALGKVYAGVCQTKRRAFPPIGVHQKAPA